MTRELARGGKIDPDAQGRMISPAVACNFDWMLTDFSEENGATLVVPGSYLSGRQPVWEKDKDAAWIPMTVKAGTKALTYFSAPQFRTQDS